jgi:hypothetical protein
MTIEILCSKPYVGERKGSGYGMRMDDGDTKKKITSHLLREDYV